MRHTFYAWYTIRNLEPTYRECSFEMYSKALELIKIWKRALVFVTEVGVTEVVD